MLQSRGGTLNLVRLTSIYYFFTAKAKKPRGNFSLSIPIINTGVKNKGLQVFHKNTIKEVSYTRCRLGRFYKVAQLCNGKTEHVRCEGYEDRSSYLPS